MELKGSDVLQRGYHGFSDGEKRNTEVSVHMSPGGEELRRQRCCLALWTRITIRCPQIFTRLARGRKSITSRSLSWTYIDRASLVLYYWTSFCNNVKSCKTAHWASLMKILSTKKKKKIKQCGRWDYNWVRWIFKTCEMISGRCGG